jgi:ABC-type glycerol-3-phosphate transport system substrate-binding protein
MKSIFGLKPRVVVWLLFATGAAILALSGCDTEPKSGFATSESSETETVRTPDPLNLLAIGVPEFDEEISRQWAAERDGELKISHITQDKYHKKDDLSAYDLIVHPSTINAELVSGRQIRVYPREGLVAPDMKLDAFLLHFRKALVRHDDKTWSVSLGGEQLKLFYRRDLLDEAEIALPETWQELADAIDKIKSSEAAKGLKPIVIPTLDGMAAQMFIARLACLIRDQGKLTSFFDRRTMKPLIEAVPFEQALAGLYQLNSISGEPCTVEGAFAKFVAGEAVFAITWPDLTEELDDKSLQELSENWGVIRLPGSTRYYDLKDPSWRDRDKNDEMRVDLLDAQANNVSITANTANASDAIEFVKWLTEKHNSRKLLKGIASPFRATHLGRIGQWYSLEAADRKFLDELADSIEETHRSRIVMMFPQLPGKITYLKMLDAAVMEFLEGDGSDGTKVLADLAKKWDALTEELDREGQTHHLRRGNGN